MNSRKRKSGQIGPEEQKEQKERENERVHILITPGRAKGLKRAVILLFWLALWQALDLIVDSKILLAGPYDTLKAWLGHLGDGDFIKIVLLSFGRIAAGFLLAFLSGSLLGAAACRFRFLRELLAPFMTVLKAVPVASFVVVLLIWWGSAYLSVAVCFLIVLPNVYTNMCEGLMQADRQLLEMARVFEMPLWNRIFYIYRPALKPFMDNCLKISLGMSWKSGIAAELIGTPDFSIGEKLYMSKIYLDTAGVFAWTVTIIILSFLFEKLGLFLWDSFCAWKPRCRRPLPSGGNKAWDLELMQLTKTYDGKQVLAGVSKKIDRGKIYCLMAPSGTGKSTLMKLLAGLERPDMPGQKISLSCSVLFQEDRLFPEDTAVRNVEAVCGSSRREEIRKHLEEVLEPEAAEQKCRTLSGGMKRRVALVRAVMADSELLLLDEPFSGLDRENKKKAAGYLLKYRKGRTVILATHGEEDAALVGGEVWRLAEQEKHS